MSRTDSDQEQARAVFPPRAFLYGLVLMSGMAALSWEVVWQIRSTLALGISAWGTAVTLAVTMGGMCVGALAMGHALKGRKPARPGRIYGMLEWMIGIGGLCLGPAFRAVAGLDTWIYASMPERAPLFYVLGVASVLGVPAMCMGATLPVLGLLARQYRASIAMLYGLNTFGAAAGTLLAAFLLIPALGIAGVTWAVAAVNIAVGSLAWTLGRTLPVPEDDAPADSPVSPPPAFGMRMMVFAVLVTGFATFMLEVAWFRMLTAAFMSTTDAFAIMLACVLVALGLGARLAPALKKRGVALGVLLGWAGILVLVVTPVIERFDFLALVMSISPVIVYLQWCAMTLYVIGGPMIFLGLALPWILDDQREPRAWGALYGLNAFAAVAGAIGAGWVFLPLIGAARTAWLAGAVAAVAGIALAPRPKRMRLAGFGVAAFLVAAVFESGIGKTRVQGTWHAYHDKTVTHVLESYEGPAATVSAVEFDAGWRMLFIDGFSTAGMTTAADPKFPSHYMPWMGHLPMLLHPDPRNALVICFGTGQTANAVRQENPQSLDIVDLNASVLKLAHNFPKNENVLGDPRVKTIVMDGRAYVRRTTRTYDIITLEPMAPTFAGVNALYSREFYRQARGRLGPHGVIAQWLPFHLLGAHFSASVARTFQSVFPNAILWIDKSGTGILLGSVDDDGILGTDWPGFRRPGGERDMSEAEVRKAVLFNPDELRRYGAYGDIITDDNQLLAYGKAASVLRLRVDVTKESKALLDRVKAQSR